MPNLAPRKAGLLLRVDASHVLFEFRKMAQRHPARRMGEKRQQNSRAVEKKKAQH